MHYVDSLMECRSGKGYCSGVTEFQKKRKDEKQYREFPYFNQYICYGCSKESSRRNGSFEHI